MLGPALALLLAAAAPHLASTEARIGVFEDQMTLTPGQVQFAATHYAGSQKQTRSQVQALKAVNPDYFVLQYRLAIGLGVHTQIVDGDRWVNEWPDRVQERWFFHRSGKREYMKQWGWYLMNTDDASWRATFTAQLKKQIADTHADGAFLDSASIPNEFGGSSWTPRLPDLDIPFENAWRAKLERWLPFVQARIGKPVIANAGTLITTRDHTDYSHVAGIMIESFALNLAPFDWNLELTRAWSLVQKQRIVICQAYPQSAGDRVFALASYLLVKGDRTFLNLRTTMAPEWYPEYDVDLGAPAGPPKLSQSGLSTRAFAKGLVVVNATDSPQPLSAPPGYELVTPQGGGAVPDSGVLPTSWRLVRSAPPAVLQPRTAAVLSSG